MSKLNLSTMPMEEHIANLHLEQTGEGGFQIPEYEEYSLSGLANYGYMSFMDDMFEQNGPDISREIMERSWAFLCREKARVWKNTNDWGMALDYKLKEVEETQFKLLEALAQMEGMGERDADTVWKQHADEVFEEYGVAINIEKSDIDIATISLPLSTLLTVPLTPNEVAALTVDWHTLQNESIQRLQNAKKVKHKLERRTRKRIKGLDMKKSDFEQMIRQEEEMQAYKKLMLELFGDDEWIEEDIYEDDVEPVPDPDVES